MLWKSIWKMIWELDTWAHLSGAFMLCTVAMRLIDTPTAVAVLILGSIALEAYQWQFQPRYVGKEMDTVLDLIADGVGIALAVVV